MRLPHAFTRALAGDQRGATIVEFALVAPTLVLLLAGVFELGHTMYVQSIVNGAIQEAGRDSTVENAQLDKIEAQVRKRVGPIAPGAEFVFRRAFHRDYALIDRLEPFTDVDGDGRCSNGDPFEDLNGNGIRDRTQGRDGQGDARDVVVFEVAVTYDRMLPMPSLSGWSDDNTVSGRTFLRNQPFRQQDRQSAVENCEGPGVDEPGNGKDPLRKRGNSKKPKPPGPPGLPGNGNGNGNGNGDDDDDDD